MDTVQNIILAVFMRLVMCIMAPEPISEAYFIDPSRQSVCLYVYPPIVARQRLDRHVPSAKNTPATKEELLDALLSMWAKSYQRKVGN
jgi:hypothetical protein